MAKAKLFAKEADLCAAFVAAIDKRVWTPYAETAGWDILLARKIDGFQIGIQAKLQLNIEVVNQAIEEYSYWAAAAPGPDCRAVLVPRGSTGKLTRVCDYLGLEIIQCDGPKPRNVSGPTFWPPLPAGPIDHRGDAWHEWCPAQRHKLPDYVPDVAAGAPSPLQLTDWKIRAIKIAVLMELRGVVRRTDFAHLKIDHRRWIANEWIVRKDDGYVVGSMPNFKAQHPIVYEKIKADAPKWMQKAAPLQPALI